MHEIDIRHPDDERRGCPVEDCKVALTLTRQTWESLDTPMRCRKHDVVLVLR